MYVVTVQPKGQVSPGNWTPWQPWTAWSENDLWPNRFYVICATPRSGSTYLCDLLTSSEIAGKPHEPAVLLRRYSTSPQFEPASEEKLEIFLKEGMTANGVFGIKVLWSQLEPLLDCIRSAFDYPVVSDAALLQLEFPGVRFIYLSRRDKVRQAVSLVRASQSGQWIARRGVNDEHRVHFDSQAIDTAYEEVCQHDRAWQQFFWLHGIRPHTLVYEDDLLAAPTASVLRILEYLDLPTENLPQIHPRLTRKQADALSEEWVQRYLDLRGVSATFGPP